MKRLIFPLVGLAIATIACSMTFDGYDNDKGSSNLPTANPTLNGLGTTGTPPPTMTGFAPAPTGTLSSGGTGSLGTGSTTSASGLAGCTPRADWPMLTVTSGMTLEFIASAVGSTVDELVQANCLTDPNAISAGQKIFVPRASGVTGATTGFSGNTTTSSTTNCPNQWFFTFEPGMATQLDACPGPVVQLPATGQNFEGGRVLRYPALPGAQDPRATIYVIYNDHTWTSFPDTWQQGQMDSDRESCPQPDATRRSVLSPRSGATTPMCARNWAGVMRRKRLLTGVSRNPPAIRPPLPAAHATGTSIMGRGAS